MRSVASRPWSRIAVGLGAVALLVSSAISPPAFAHSAATFYPAVWSSNTSVHWVFDNNVPTGAFRDSVKFGLGQWDNFGEGRQPRSGVQVGPDRPCPGSTEACLEVACQIAVDVDIADPVRPHSSSE